MTPSGGSLALGPLTKVSAGPSDYSGSPCCNFGNDYGDYTGIDATGGTAFPVWSDNSTGGGDGEAEVFVDQPNTAQTPTPVTGAASNVGSQTADVGGTVNPHLQQTTWHVEYGTGLGYGNLTGNQTLAASGSPGGVDDAVVPFTEHHVPLPAGGHERLGHDQRRRPVVHHHVRNHPAPAHGFEDGKRHGDEQPQRHQLRRRLQPVL